MGIIRIVFEVERPGLAELGYVGGRYSGSIAGGNALRK